MSKLTPVIENIARAFVWEKPKWRIQRRASMVDLLSGFYEIKYMKVHAVALGGTAIKPRIEIYAQPKAPREQIKRIVYESVSKKISCTFIDCLGFKIHQNLSVGDKVKHKNLKGFGTLGGFVNDLYSPYRLAISNNHVFAQCNLANINDDLINLNSNSVFGGLHRFAVLKTPPAVNEIDAAVGWIYKEQRLFWKPRKPLSSGTPYRGMRVYKYGAATDYTEGIIQSIHAAPAIDYQSLGMFNFRECIIIRGINGPFSKRGDSGSLVVSTSGVVVGLLFAGEIDGRYSLANNFKYVENQLGIVYT
ncbi:MAG: hypothetical protein ACFFDN_52080 [Candidatus Hodarchaeota archaeon]